MPGLFAKSFHFSIVRAMAAQQFCGFYQSASVKPGGEARRSSQTIHFAGEDDEDVLRSFFGLGMTTGPSQSDAKYQARIFLYQRAKCSFIAGALIPVQQFRIWHGRFYHSIPQALIFNLLYIRCQTVESDKHFVAG